jgi:hypothetical protein
VTSSAGSSFVASAVSRFSRALRAGLSASHMSDFPQQLIDGCGDCNIARMTRSHGDQVAADLIGIDHPTLPQKPGPFFYHF